MISSTAVTGRATSCKSWTACSCIVRARGGGFLLVEPFDLLVEPFAYTFSVFSRADEDGSRRVLEALPNNVDAGGTYVVPQVALLSERNRIAFDLRELDVPGFVAKQYILGEVG